MSNVYKKYFPYMFDFREYRAGSTINKCNGLEIHTKNNVRLIKGGLISLAGQETMITVNEATLARDNFTFFCKFKVLRSLSGTHHIYSYYNKTGAQPRFLMRLSGGGIDFSCVASNGTSQTVYATLTEELQKYYAVFATINFNTNSLLLYVNGLLVGSASLAAVSGSFTIETGSSVGHGSGRSVDNNELLSYCGLIKNYALSATEIWQLTQELEAMPDQRPWSKAVDYDGTTTINFKGELGAIANEVTIASGYLENTGVRILSGSFKMVTEINSGRIEKVIQYVTNGSLYFPQMSSSVSGVSRCIDGTIIKTDLATARTITLTAGQDLVYASENELRSLYQEV